MEIDHLSPSTINSFRQCPRKWKFGKDRLEGLMVPEDKMLYGGAVHNIIALYYDKIPQNPTPGIVMQIIDRAFDEGYTHIMKNFTRKTNTIKQNFYEFEVSRLRNWRSYHPTFVEKRLETKIWSDIPRFTVIIDFFSELDKTLIDWKSGGLEMRESTMIQGKSYDLVLKALGYEVEKAMFFGLSNGRQLITPKLTKGWLYQICKDMIDQARNNRFPAKESPLCGWCPYILRCQFFKQCLWMVN